MIADVSRAWSLADGLLVNRPAKTRLVVTLGPSFEDRDADAGAVEASRVSAVRSSDGDRVGQVVDRADVVEEDRPDGLVLGQTADLRHRRGRSHARHGLIGSTFL